MSNLTSMWIWLVGPALATPLVEEPDEIEEIVVVAEKNGWDGVRWRVRSDLRLPDTLTLPGADGPLEVDAWTLDWVLQCELKGFRHAACAVEDASLQVVGLATQDLERAVDVAGSRLAELTVHVRFGGDDQLGGVDVLGLGSDDGLGTLVDLAMRGFGGGMPTDSLEDDAVWWRGQDPMLALHGFDTVVSRTDVNHFGNRRDGWYFVQRVGRIRVAETDMPDGVEIPEPMRRLRADGTAIPARAWVGAHLRGTSWFDLESGFLYGRDVHVEGFPRDIHASLKVRRLDPHAEVQLEPSGVRHAPPADGALLAGGP